jgi:hypothetical protein
MAAEKTSKDTGRVGRRGSAPASDAADKPAKKKATPAEAKSALRLRTDPRKERRFEPRAGAIAVVSVIGLSIGAVVLGAGTYGQWLRPDTLGPHRAAPWLLLSGALVFIAIAFAGPRPARSIRVGDAGVGEEKDDSIERIAWRDVERIFVDGRALVVESTGAAIVVSLKLHGQAAARIVREAKSRIAGKLEDVDGEALEPLEADAGEVVPLEAPQVAGSRCKASDKLIAFEKDSRFCGKCGEVYHKDHVPPKCLTCEAKLA